MRKKTLVLSLLLACATAFGQSSYDLVIVGGNPGGIMAAISAARMGKKSVILERTRYVGGLPANGLGATDIATRAATTGLFREFVDGVKQHYIDTYGPGSEQVKVCSDRFRVSMMLSFLILSTAYSSAIAITANTASAAAR